MKKCRCEANFSCHYVTNGGFCTLPENSACILQEEYVEPDEASTVTTRAGLTVVGLDDKNKTKICCDEITLSCDEITLTKDSIGIEVNIQNLIQGIDNFETIEINGRVFKRVRAE